MKMNYYRSNAGTDLPSIADAALGSSTLSTFSRFLRQADLEELLRGEGYFTLFAPTDKAFANLPTEVLDELGRDPQKLRHILEHHVLPSQRERATFLNGRLKTMAGTLVSVGITDDGVTLDQANTCGREIACANGVIHPIDAVLTPDGYTPDIGDNKNSPWAGHRRPSRTRAQPPERWTFGETKSDG